MVDTVVAVLGGGISGCLTACLLADRGISVILVDQSPELMSGASLWNDGKIHLGYTFTGTPSLATAALMQQGAATFVPVLERILGRRLPERWFGARVVYVVDEASMFDAETLWRRAQAVAAMLDPSPDRRAAATSTAESQLEWLDADRAQAETGQAGVVAGWRTSERHVSPRAIAGSIHEAVAARPITRVTARVEAVRPGDTCWEVQLDGGRLEARIVVNCLWESRAAIDRCVADVTDPVSIRYKHCLVGRGTSGLGHLAPSTRILGKYGDLVTWTDGDAYLSWYPVALAARSDDGYPPQIPPLDHAAMAEQTLRGLNLPVGLLDDPSASWEVGGGYVVAYGYGDIDTRSSPLHTRHRAGVRELRPGFVSVDTGKYTLGPMMASRAARLVEQRLLKAN